MWRIHWDTCSIHVYEIICASGMYVTFKRNICHCHIYGNGMVNKSYNLLFLTCICSNGGLCVDYSSSAVGHMYAMWQT